MISIRLQLVSICLLLIGKPLASDKVAVAIDKLAAESDIQGSAFDKLAAAVDKQVTAAKTHAACMRCMCLPAKCCKRS